MENKQLFLISKEELERTLRDFIKQYSQDIKRAAYEGVKQAMLEPNDGLFLSKKQVCKLLNISYYSLQKLISDGILETSPNGKKITKASVDKYINQISQE